MLGVISERASLSTVTRTLKVLEETLHKHEDDVTLLEAIVVCLTRHVPLLDEVCGVRVRVGVGCRRVETGIPVLLVSSLAEREDQPAHLLGVCRDTAG